MKDKVVLVTGGGTGIGKAIAKRFIDLGAFVVITGRRESKLSETAEQLGANASYMLATYPKPGLLGARSGSSVKSMVAWMY